MIEYWKKMDKGLTFTKMGVDKLAELGMHFYDFISKITVLFLKLLFYF